MWLLVAVGMLLDAALAYAAGTLGWQIPFSFMVAVLVCMWQLANELISIIENVDDMGVRVPGFLIKIIEWVRSKAEPDEAKGLGGDEQSGGE